MYYTDSIVTFFTPLCTVPNLLPPTILVSLGCYSKTPQVGRFEQKFIFSQFWKMGVSVQNLGEWVPGKVSLPGLQTTAF